MGSQSDILGRLLSQHFRWAFRLNWSRIQQLRAGLQQIAAAFMNPDFQAAWWICLLVSCFPAMSLGLRGLSLSNLKPPSKRIGPTGAMFTSPAGEALCGFSDLGWTSSRSVSILIPMVQSPFSTTGKSRVMFLEHQQPKSRNTHCSIKRVNCCDLKRPHWKLWRLATEMRPGAAGNSSR